MPHMWHVTWECIFYRENTLTMHTKHIACYENIRIKFFIFIVFSYFTIKINIFYNFSIHFYNLVTNTNVFGSQHMAGGADSNMPYTVAPLPEREAYTAPCCSNRLLI